MKVPSPGESITEVEIAAWLVKDGDYVEKDQAIAEVDSDKATLELPAEESGIITLKAEEGDAVGVGEVVCLIDTSAPNRKEPLHPQRRKRKRLQRNLRRHPKNHQNRQQYQRPMPVEHLLLQHVKYWTKKTFRHRKLSAPAGMAELPRKMP